MTPRPVAPESETPETDEFSNPSTEGDNDSFVAIEHYNSLLEHARSLERRLSLAQTEIKGHMRNIDDLKVDLRRTKADLACAEENFHVTNQAYVKADNERALAQARISELEGHIRVLTRPAWNSEGHMLPTLPQVEAARAALKSRA